MGVIHFGALLGRDAALGKKVPTTERLDNTKNPETIDTNVSFKVNLVAMLEASFHPRKITYSVPYQITCTYWSTMIDEA